MLRAPTHVRPHAHGAALTDSNEFLWKTNRWMSLGVGLTGLVAWLVASSPSLFSMIAGNSIVFYGLMLAELGVVVYLSARVHTMSASRAASFFLGYSALNGLTMSVIFMAYTQGSIASTFFITAGAFAGLSVYGATTKTDLTAMGRFLMFGLIGLVIAMVVNIFLGSAAIEFIISSLGVLIFAGLTAYDTQKLKDMHRQFGDGGNLAIRGALTLYLDFINLFLFLLRFLGNRR